MLDMLLNVSEANEESNDPDNDIVDCEEVMLGAYESLLSEYTLYESIAVYCYTEIPVSSCSIQDLDVLTMWG